VQLYCFEISDTSVASGNLDANKRYPSVNDAFSSAEGLAVILIYFIQLGISGLFAYWDWRQLKDNKAGCRQKLMDLLPFTLATISQSFWNFHGILMVSFFRRTIKWFDQGLNSEEDPDEFGMWIFFLVLSVFVLAVLMLPKLIQMAILKAPGNLYLTSDKVLPGSKWWFMSRWAERHLAICRVSFGYLFAKAFQAFLWNLVRPVEAVDYIFLTQFLVLFLWFLSDYDNMAMIVPLPTRASFNEDSMNAAIQIQDAMKVCEPRARQQGSNGENAWFKDTHQEENPLQDTNNELSHGPPVRSDCQRAISDDETGAGSSSHRF